MADLFQEDEQANAAANAATKPRIASPRDLPHVSTDQPFHFPVQLPRVQVSYRKTSVDSLQSSTSDKLYLEPHQHETASSAHAYSDLSMDSLSTSGLAFPGLFSTKFDEENPLRGFGRRSWEGDEMDSLHL
jgi:hypothetical protein